MQISKLKPGELRDADRLDSYAFVCPMPEAQKEDSAKPAYQVDRWGLFDDSGAMACTLFNHNLPLYFDGRIVPARGVGGVASDPVSRGQGNIRALFQRVLEDDYQSGVLFSALFPFSHSFYRKFGYELCYEAVKARFATRDLRCFQTADPPQARLLRPEDGTEALRPLYAAMAQPYNCMVARDENAWRRLQTGDPDKGERYCYVLSRNGQDVAFAVFYFKQGDKPYLRTLHLVNCGYADPAGFYDMMGFLYRYSSVAQTTEVFLPEGLPLTTLLPEAGSVELVSDSKPMARAVHAEGVLKAMRHPSHDGSYTIEIEDAFLKQNSGSYAVRYTADGTATVTRYKGEADLRLSIHTFTQLALGFMGLTDALFKPDAALRGNRETLEAVFVQKPKFMLDWY